MPQLSIIVSESEAADRLEELIGLALEGQSVMVEADNGQLIMLEPVSDD
jgi:hypothetical protein